MSRLYDALTEASRVRKGLGPNGTTGLWGGEIPDIEIPPIQTAVEEAAPPPDVDFAGSVTTEAGALEAGPPPPTPAPQVPPAEFTAGLNRFLGSSTTASLDKKARLIPHAMDSSVIEHYRRLRTKILQKRDEKPFRSLLVTSANPQEGKTVTVLNLGLSFAMLPGFKVLVIDGDLRRGSLARSLGVPEKQPGLADVISGTAKLEDVVLHSDEVPMHFIVRGNARVTDMHASQFDVHFRSLAEDFDLIIVDSPPVNLLADVQLLASACEAVLLVARSFVTSRQTLEKAVQDLQTFNVIGTVLNAAAKGRSQYYSGYY
jgi:protein-tyrosine kinase